MHHLLIYSADHDPRVPPFLRGALTAVPVKRYSDVGAHTNAAWYDAARKRYDFREPLSFIAHEERIDLDFYPVADGFLASQRLEAVLERLAPGSVRAMPVTMTDEAGKPNTARPMRFCQILPRHCVCDVDRLMKDVAHHPDLDGANHVEMRDGRMAVVRAITVPLLADLPGLVEASDLPHPAMLVSDAIATAFGEADLLGVRLVSVAEIAVVDFWPTGPGDYVLRPPQWVQQTKLATWLRLNGRPKRAKFTDHSQPSSDPAIAGLVQGALDQINRTPRSTDWRISAAERYPGLEPHDLETPFAFWMALRCVFEKAVKIDDAATTAQILCDVRDWLDMGATAEEAAHDPYTSVVIGFLEGLLEVRGADKHLVVVFEHDELLEMKVFLAHGLFNGRRYAALMRLSAAR
jgi:hypothetical protein